MSIQKKNQYYLGDATWVNSIKNGVGVWKEKLRIFPLISTNKKNDVQYVTFFTTTEYRNIKGTHFSQFSIRSPKRYFVLFSLSANGERLVS